MALFSIGHVNPYGDDDQEPAEHLQVEADDEYSPVTSIINAGDDAAFAMAHEELGRLTQGGVVATPAALAQGILGRGATVHEVDPDDGDDIEPLPAE